MSLSTPLLSYLYSFDGVSNVMQIDDRRPGDNLPGGDERRNTQLFTYDDLYRLTGVQYSFNLPDEALRNNGHIDYRYDRIGNMISSTSDIGHKENGLSITDLGEMSYGGDLGAWGRAGRNASEAGPHGLIQLH
jgi:hypothetical protein